MARICVVRPIGPGVPAEIMAASDRCLDAMTKYMGDCKGFTLDAICYDRKLESQPGDRRPWSRVARVRNAFLNDVPWDIFDYLLWIDADVVEYPPDMAKRLVDANPGGMSAPLPLIEGSDRLYDWMAFVIAGMDRIHPSLHFNIPGRNLAHAPPYWPNEPGQTVVEMACVGMVTLVPTWVYRFGARYEDHPAFTDHYPICRAIRTGGKKVVCHRGVIARHADLPKYGLQWH